METYTEFALVAHRGLGAEIFIEPLKELGIKATPFFFHELPDLHTLKRFSAIICIRDFSSTNLLDRVKRHANEGNVPLFVLSRKTSHWASLLSAGLLGGSVQSREDALTRLFALDEERPPRWFEFVGQNPHLQGFMPSTVRSLAALKDFLSRIPPEKLPESLRKKYQGVDAPPSQPNPVTAPPEPEVVSEPAPPAPAPVELVLGVDQAEYDLLKEEYDSLVQIHEAAKARIVELEQQIGGYQENLGQLTQAYTERKDWVSPQAVAKLRDKMLAEKAKELLEGQQRQAALEKQVKGLQEELGAYESRAHGPREQRASALFRDQPPESPQRSGRREA